MVTIRVRCSTTPAPSTQNRHRLFQTSTAIANSIDQGRPRRHVDDDRVAEQPLRHLDPGPSTIGARGVERRGTVHPVLAAGQLRLDRHQVDQRQLDLQQPGRPLSQGLRGPERPGSSPLIERQRRTAAGQRKDHRDDEQDRVARVEHVEAAAHERQQQDEHQGRRDATVPARREGERRHQQHDPADQQRGVAGKPLEEAPLVLHLRVLRRDALLAEDAVEVGQQCERPHRHDDAEHHPDQAEGEGGRGGEPEGEPPVDDRVHRGPASVSW